MLSFLRKARPPNATQMSQLKEPNQLKPHRLDNVTDLDIVFPEVPTPPQFPGDIINPDNITQISSTKLSRKASENLSIQNFLKEINSNNKLEELNILLNSHKPSSSTSASTNSTISYNMNSPGSKNALNATKISDRHDQESNRTLKRRSLDERISQGLVRGIQSIFVYLLKSTLCYLLNNDIALYGLSFLLFPYLAYIYMSASSVLLLVGIILISCCIFKFSKFLLSEYLPENPLHSNFLRCLQNYSILDVILAFGYLKYLAFYLSRLYILAFVELSPAERTMIFQDWDPRMDKIVKTRLIEFIPNILRRFMDNKANHSQNEINIAVTRHDNQAEIEQNLDEFELDNNDIYDVNPSELPAVSNEQSEGITTQQNWNSNFHLIEGGTNNVEAFPLQISPTNLRSLPKTKSNFIPIVTQIILRRLLFHPQIEKFFYKFKLHLYHIFSISAGISIIFYSPLVRRFSKKLPIGFFILSILSFYFYLLTHGWPKFLSYRKKKIGRKLPLPQSLSPRSSKNSSEDDLPRTATIEDAWTDIIGEFTRRHTHLPKIKQ